MGKIRLGIKVTGLNGREYPKAVDYFVCPPEVQAVYGEQPTALDILLPVDNADLIASTWYKAYSASRGLVCRGDGIAANRLIDSSHKTVESGTGVLTGPIASRDAPSTEMALGITCPGRACPYYESKRCRELMSLQFLMPTVPGLGVWQLDTSSYHSILNIYNGMELVRGIFGTAAMIPLKLSLEPLEVSPEGRRKTVRVLYLRSDATLAQIAESMAKPLVPSLMPEPDEEREGLLFPDDFDGELPERPAGPEPERPAGQCSTGQLGQCPTHGRTWAPGPGDRIGHTGVHGKWCWRDEAPAPELDREGSPAPEPRTAVAVAPTTQETLEDHVVSLGWTWKEFETDVLKMPWRDWEKLGGTVATAWEQYRRHEDF